MVEKVEATKEDIELYLESAKGRIRSAEVLLREREYNDAISRAYYAFFDAAAAALLTEGFRVKTHGGLKAMFFNHFIKTERMPKQFGRYLTKAFDARQNADYHVRIKFNKEAVEAAISSAKEFLAEIEKIIK